MIATARRASERRHHMKAAGAFTLELNVTWPQKYLDFKVREVIEAYDGIDVFINSAGCIETGFVEDARYVESTLMSHIADT